MNASALNPDNAFCSIEVLVFELSKLTSVNSVGIPGTEPVNVKISCSLTNLLIGSKGYLDIAMPY